MRCLTDMKRWVTVGAKERSVERTQMNAQSSRSHAIFTIRIKVMVRVRVRVNEGPLKLRMVIHDQAAKILDLEEKVALTLTFALALTLTQASCCIAQCWVTVTCCSAGALLHRTVLGHCNLL